MKVLGIGYGRHLFEQDNFEFRRLERCAEEVESFDQIIFAKKDVGLERLEANNNFILHPTNSLSKLTMIYSAVRIGTRLIKEKQIDTVTAQDPFETGLVGLILKYRFPQIVLHVQEHGDVLSSAYWREEKISNRLRYHFAMFLLKRADVIRVVSNRTQLFLQTKLSPTKKIKKLPVVVDTESFASGIEAMELKTRKDFIFLTAGRFVPQKNFPLMLTAFAKARESTPGLKLKIYGDGPQKPLINSLINKLDLDDSVELSGWTSDLAEEMRTADAYLLTSNYEGWGRVLIEALLLKLPIVTTDVGCANEVIKNNEHGLVVSVGQEEELKEAIVKIATDKHFYDSIKVNLRSIDKNNLPGTDVDAYAINWADTLRK